MKSVVQQSHIIFSFNHSNHESTKFELEVWMPYRTRTIVTGNSNSNLNSRTTTPMEGAPSLCQCQKRGYGETTDNTTVSQKLWTSTWYIGQSGKQNHQKDEIARRIVDSKKSWRKQHQIWNQKSSQGIGGWHQQNTQTVRRRFNRDGDIPIFIHDLIR